MTRFVVGAVIAAFGATCVYAQPLGNKGRWHWVWVTPGDGNKGWSVFEGDAAVTFTARGFDATLEGVAPGQQPSLHLFGALNGRRVTATGVRVGTDASPEHFVGEIERNRTKLSDPSHGWGSDRLVLRAGSTFVGLYRQVQSDPLRQE